MPMRVGLPSHPHSFLIEKRGNLIVAQDSRGRIQYSGTDASTVIQNCINALTNGGRIFIKAGTYLLKSRLTIDKDGVTIAGEGHGVSVQRGVTILKQADGANITTAIISVSGRNCHLRDLFVDGNKSNNAQLAYGILFGSEDGSLENIGVMFCTYDGVNVQTHAAYFKQVFSESNGGSGFVINNAWGTIFEDCYACVNVNHGYYIIGNSHHNTFVGCVSQDDAKDGFVLQSYTGMVQYNSFIGCQAFQQSYATGNYGFRLLGAQHNVFKGCQVTNMGQAANNTYDGFYLAAQDTNNSIRNLIEGCIIVSTATNKLRYGINEANTNQDYNIFLGNIITGMATAAINKQGVNSISDHNIT